MATKNMFRQNGINRKTIDIIVGDMFSTEDDKNKKFRTLKNLKDEYIKAKKDGTIYAYEKCNCLYGKFGCYKRCSFDYKNERIIRVRKTCEYCDKEKKETLHCFDFCDLIKFIQDDFLYDECFDHGNRDIDKIIMNDIENKIYKYDDDKYLELYREWLKRLSLWDNSYRKEIWKALVKIESQHTFIEFFGVNFFLMWD